MMLDEAVDKIISRVTEKMVEAVYPGGPLEGVESIVRGDRHKTTPPTPALWIFCEAATVEHSQLSIQEQWTLPVSFVAVVKDNNPEEGYARATRLAALARSVILKDRTLGLREFVQDTRSNRFEPSAPWHREGALFGSVAVVDVSFRIKEV